MGISAEKFASLLESNATEQTTVSVNGEDVDVPTGGRIIATDPASFTILEGTTPAVVPQPEETLENTLTFPNVKLLGSDFTTPFRYRTAPFFSPCTACKHCSNDVKNTISPNISG